MDGWVCYDSYWREDSTNQFDYASFPDGFNKTSWYYTNYNKNCMNSFESETNKRSVENTHLGHIYWHWCRGTYAHGPINRRVENYQTGEFVAFHAFDTTDNYPEASDGCSQCSNS